MRSTNVGVMLHGAIVEKVVGKEPVNGDASVKRDRLAAGGLMATRTIGSVKVVRPRELPGSGSTPMLR